MKSFILIFALAFLVGGCGSVISTTGLTGVDRSITVPAVQANPDSYTGKKVLWGGTIVSSENLTDTTLIEVLEAKLSISDMPGYDRSRGRFLIEAKGYLDPLVYKADMNITIAGTIKGIMNKKIGEMTYPYPVIEPVELKLIEVVDYQYQPYYYDPFYFPYYDYYDRPYIYDGYYPWPHYNNPRRPRHYR